MHFYQVGGAVRDMLLHKPCQDRDFVVTGGTEKEMLALVLKKSGKAFPFFCTRKPAKNMRLPAGR